MGYNTPRHGRPSIGQRASLGSRVVVAGGTTAVAAGALALSAGVAGAAPLPQYANPVANGAGAHASYAAGTWTLDSGHGVGGGAQVDLVKPGTAVTAPAFTADHEQAGNPRWVVEFHNGDYLFGYPAAGANESSLNWTLEPGNHVEPSYAAALAAAQAGGSDDQVTAAFIVNDTGNPDTTVNLTGVTYNGRAVVPAGKPAPHPVPRPHLYDGHVMTVNNNDAQIGWKYGPGVHYVLTRTFGYGFSPNGSPHLGFTSSDVGYWSGLAAGHTYDIELIPAGADRQPLPHAQVGWITIVTTR